MSKSIEDLRPYFNEKVISVLKNNYSEIWDYQWECIQKCLVEQQSLLICLPTGSGKTFPAFLSIIDAVLNKNSKAVYVVPLRALAKQKCEQFKKLLEPLGISIGISTGDYAKQEYKNIGAKNVIITTIEKLDSFIRHDEDWLYDVSLFVIDEVQMVDDQSRGLTLEMVVSEILRKYPSAQRIAISAVIGNSEEFKNWIADDLVYNERRIIPLNKGVLSYDGDLKFRRETLTIPLRNNLYSFRSPQNDKDKNLRYSNTIDLVKHFINEQKQCIIFTNSRDNAENLAISFVRDIKNGGYSINESECEIFANILESSIEEETLFSQQLIECVRFGVCFHHAGLHFIQRGIIERGFENKKLKLIVATPTLEQGVNLPADVVIIPDLVRWNNNSGSYEFLPTNNVLNMMGRAGRPNYHESGEAVLIEGPQTSNQLHGRYIVKRPERVLSQLRMASTRRKHLNGLIASNKIVPVDEIIEFLKTTLWFSIYEYVFEDFDLQEEIFRDLTYLEEKDFIKKLNSYYIPTKFGRIVADSCIDCDTGLLFQKASQKIKSNLDLWGSPKPWPILQLLLLSPEISVYRPYDNDFKGLEIASHFQSEGLLLSEFPSNQAEDEIHTYSRRSLLAYLFCDWMEEKPLKEIVEYYSELKDADFYEIGDVLEWLGDAFVKIAIFNDVPKGITDEILIYCDRVVEGVKEDLLELVKIEGVRRKSARKLLNSSYSYSSLKDLNHQTLSKLVGPFVAGKIKKHFEQVEAEGEEPDYNEEQIYGETEEVFEEDKHINSTVEIFKQNDEFFEYGLNDPELKSRFIKIKSHCESNLSWIHSDSHYFRFFTNHTGLHSANVFNLINKLLSDWELVGANNKLNDYEYFLLAVCSWCHDLGMLKQGCEDFDDINVVEKARKEHAQRIISYLDSRFMQMGLLDEIEKVIVSKICSHHSSSTNIEELEETESRLLNEEPVEVRTKLLASLLRLADALDADKERLPREENRNHPQISEYTKREYRKHEIVQEVVINSSRKTIFVQAVVNRNNSDDLTIYEELKEKMTNEFNSVKSVLLSRGINIENISFLEISS